MAKKNTLVNQILGFVPLVLALILFLMMFADGAVLRDSDGAIQSTVAGTKLAFGQSQTALGIESRYNANVLLMLSFLLPLIVALAAMILHLVGQQKVAFWLDIALLVVFLLAIIGMFTAVSVSSVSVVAGGTTTTSTLKDGGWTLGAGTITGGIFAILGFLATGVNTIVPLVLKK